MWKCIVEFSMSKRDFCHQHSRKARQAIASHTSWVLTIPKCLYKAVFTQEKFLSRVTTWPLVSNVTTPTRVDEYSSPPRGWCWYQNDLLLPVYTIPHIWDRVRTHLESPWKSLKFEIKSSRPWKSLKIAVGAGKSLNFGANFIQPRFSST